MLFALKNAKTPQVAYAGVGPGHPLTCSAEAQQCAVHGCHISTRHVRVLLHHLQSGETPRTLIHRHGSPHRLLGLLKACVPKVN